MKKIFTYSFLFAVCFSFFASCSKDVKAPAKPAGATASTTTYTGTQPANHDQGGQTCGGGSYSSNTGGNGY